MEKPIKPTDSEGESNACGFKFKGLSTHTHTHTYTHTHTPIYIGIYRYMAVRASLSFTHLSYTTPSKDKTHYLNGTPLVLIDGTTT